MKFGMELRIKVEDNQDPILNEVLPLVILKCLKNKELIRSISIKLGTWSNDEYPDDLMTKLNVEVK